MSQDFADFTRPVTALTSVMANSDLADWTLGVVAVSPGGSVVVGDTTTVLLPTGAIAETASRLYNFGSFTPTGGFEYASPIALTAGETIGHISFVSSNTGFVSATHLWFALYDSSVNLLAITADHNAEAWTANTVKTLAIANIASGASTTFTTTYSGLYYISMMVAGGGAFTTFSLSIGAGIGPLQVLAPIPNPVSAGTNTVPHTFPFSMSVQDGTTPMYGYVSA